MKSILKRQVVTFACLIGLVVMGSCQSSCNDKIGISRGGTGAETAICGEFELVDIDIRDNHYENGIDAMLEFQFNSAECEPTCSTDAVGFIQIVRTVDLSEPDLFYYPSLEKKNRATPNGWYIDRAEGFIWAYFGMDNDGTFLPYVTPGTDSRLAWMTDSPYRPEGHPYLGILWEAVTVVVHIHGSSDCRNDKRGYYYWSWYVTEDGAVEDIQHRPALQTLAAEVDSALMAWNKQAPELGANEFPTQILTMRWP